jgi:ferredoxin-NADP reductase
LGLEVAGWPGHLAGQHVDIRLTAPDGYQAQRSYSIASAPDDAQLELTVERLSDGEVSPYLADELREGDELELRGPIGGYFVWKESFGGPVMLVAGGSGIVPLRSILRHWSAVGSDVEVRLLYSTRSWEQVIYRDELSTLRAAGVRVDLTLTRAWPADWDGRRGRIDRDMLEEVSFGATDGPLTYVCGPTPMVEGVASALVEIGHRPERIRTERFGPTGG